MSMLGIEVGFVLVICIAVVFAVGLQAWHIRRSEGALQKWATRNNFRLVEQEYRRMARGPFILTSSKNQAVFRVVVEDGSGNVRCGWVKCGNWWTGLFSEETQVRWDDEVID